MKVAGALLVALQGAAAHTIFTQLNGNPVIYGIRDPSYDGVSLPVAHDYHPEAHNLHSPSRT